MQSKLSDLLFGVLSDLNLIDDAIDEGVSGRDARAALVRCKDVVSMLGFAVEFIYFMEDESNDH